MTPPVDQGRLGEAVFNSPPAAGGSGRGDVGLVVPDDHGGDGFEGAEQVRQEVGGVRRPTTLIINEKVIYFEVVE